MTESSTSPLSTETDLNLKHLEAELVRIDVLIHCEVRRWQLAGQDPTDAFRGQYVSDDEARALLSRPFGTSWGQTSALTPQEKQGYAAVLKDADNLARSVIEAAQHQGQMLRLAHLTRAFGLDRFDVDTLLICLAPTLDLRYERLYGYLQDDVTRKRPSINLVLDLLCEPGPDRLKMLSRFADDAPLFRHHLLERITEPEPGKPPLLRHTLYVDQTIVSWLVGNYQPHADLGAHARLSQPQAGDKDVLLTADVQPTLMHIARADTPLLAVFFGPDKTGQQAAANVLAAEMNRSLLTVDLAEATEAEALPLHALRLALRDARLTGAIPYVVNINPRPENEKDTTPPPAMLAALCDHPDLAIVTSPARWQPTGVDRTRDLFWIEFPIPAYSQRLALWGHFLSQKASGSELDITGLAGQFLLTSGQIRDPMASASDRAAQRGSALDIKDLFAAARDHSSRRLGKLTRKINPRYTWQDIVLPDDQLAILREIVATVWGRPLVLDKWGVGQKLTSSAGVTVLFSGPPGTGKTMAAEVIAAELGLDLYKIDLSTVVSKYIGETEKNLERIFEEAEHSNAILFFDEADALFGKRSEVKDAHDRYANIEISYLLQRMEAYDGVTMLATNLRANLDEAFTRRLQFAVDFPFPEKEYRLRIWQALFPPGVPRDADLDFDFMAQRFKLAGGNIRNIIVNAAFLAASDGGQVTMAHLLHGTRREMQKMGRLVPEADLTIG